MTGPILERTRQLMVEMYEIVQELYEDDPRRIAFDWASLAIEWIQLMRSLAVTKSSSMTEESTDFDTRLENFWKNVRISLYVQSKILLNLLRTCCTMWLPHPECTRRKHLEQQRQQKQQQQQKTTAIMRCSFAITMRMNFILSVMSKRIVR
jgi:hypothetical protein